MSEWWTYRPADFLLFSPETYYRLFELYHRALWPGQVIAIAAGLAALFLAMRGKSRAAAAILAAAWIWVGWAFLLERYATINFAARWFAAAFVLQAVLLLWSGAIRDRLRLEGPLRAPQRAGLALAAFALVIHPVVAIMARGSWTQAELFGMTPDPTVVATLGLVVFLGDRVRWPLLVVPLLWCAVGGITLWVLRSPEAFILPLSGAVAIAAGIGRKR